MLKDISLKHSMLHRKFTLELTRQFPEICGYIITAIRDVPIATSGIFDDFMNVKFSPSEFRKFNDDIVLSPAWDLRRTWVNGGDRVLNKDKYNYWSGDEVGLHVVISNYSKKDLTNPEIEWRVMSDGDEVITQYKGRLSKKIDIGSVEELIDIRFKLPVVKKACGLWIYVALRYENIEVQNKWRIWVYPKELKDTSKDRVLVYDTLGILQPLKKFYKLIYVNDEDEINGNILVTTRITPTIEKYLKQGGKSNNKTHRR